MTTRENIIATANGLETVYWKFWAKSTKYGLTEGERALIEFQAKTVLNQLNEMRRSDMFKSVIAEVKEMNRPFSEALKATAGMSGFEILMNLNKSA